ncbi:hypothetical protein PoB_005456300 [Plakobranchus ocellatus]|uniref:Uncharacterized protein n=1 Tax=Plakobranchus ocellatus TaxID=259542 RepID=A0AAV4C861_9GAST|nr:hypothetical protein PoB_005456300 [Plakobranchus ocellatus]
MSSADPELGVKYTRGRPQYSRCLPPAWHRNQRVSLSRPLSLAGVDLTSPRRTTFSTHEKQKYHTSKELNVRGLILKSSKVSSTQALDGGFRDVTIETKVQNKTMDIIVEHLDLGFHQLLGWTQILATTRTSFLIRRRYDDL